MEQNKDNLLGVTSAYTSDRQRLPITNAFPNIAELVIDDVAERMRIGTERYGTPLQPFNGRDALKDAYEEVLDLASYMRQMMYERDTELRENAQAALDVKRLADWFMQYAPDEIEEGSAVTNAIKLIERLRFALEQVSDDR
jgi:hypothetical protein